MIEVLGLSKRFGGHQAVDGVAFRVEPGEFVALLGPNGAGKSTTVKMLTGILHPDAGSVRVAGRSPQRERRALAREIGVVFGQRTGLWWDLPVCDSFDLLAAMYRVRAAAERAAELRSLLDLDGFWHTPVRRLSLGQRVRADIAAALLHRPKVLFLDEPTVGLDLLAKERVREFLSGYGRQGATVLLTTHDLAEVEALCGRVLVMNGGRLAFDGTVADLRQRAGVPTLLTVEYAGEPVGEPAWPAVARDGRSLTVSFDRSQVGAGTVLAALGELGEILDIRLHEPDLEKMVRRLYLPPACARDDPRLP